MHLLQKLGIIAENIMCFLGYLEIHWSNDLLQIDMVIGLQPFLWEMVR